MFLGADPEFAIIDSTGKAISAHKAGIEGKSGKVSLVGGEPSYEIGTVFAVKGRRIGTLQGEFAKYFRDGWMIEVNPKAELCRAYLLNNLADALHTISTLPLMVENRWKLTTLPTVPVEKEDLDETPSDVRTFGCDPSFDAYGEGKSKTVNIDDGSLHYARYAGGHMHFSHYDEAVYVEKLKTTPPKAAAEDINVTEFDRYPEMIRWLDRTVGIATAVIFGDPSEFQRRKYYGQAGEFRPQAYPYATKITEYNKETKAYDNKEVVYEKIFRGLEYRVPGPQMWNHPSIVAAFYGMARWILRTYKHLPFDPAQNDTVRQIINEGTFTPEEVKKVFFSVPGYMTVETLFALREWVKSNKDELGVFSLKNWSLEAHNSWTFITAKTPNPYTTSEMYGKWKDLPIYHHIFDIDGRAA